MTNPTIHDIDLNQIKKPGKYKFWLELITSPMGVPMRLPVMIIKGATPGKVMGITSALHGNEINGIPIIHRLFRKIEPENLKGSIVAVPVVNVPAFLNKERRFVDNVDLNHIMPGVENGTVSEVYAYRFFHRVVRNFDYLVDLHTASFGRINSYYIRSDMNEEVTAEITRLMNAEIVVHNPPMDGTLRGAASAINIPAITLELGNPNVFQKRIILSAYKGFMNVLSYLGFTEGAEVDDVRNTVYCSSSEWIYTTEGGILRVLPDVTDKITKGERIAYIQNIFGETIEDYIAPYDSIVIGKSTFPINQTGGRIMHIGKVINHGTRNSAENSRIEDSSYESSISKHD